MNKYFPKQLRVAFLWIVAIFWLCTMKPSELPRASVFPPYFDKIVHAGFYFVLTFLLSRGFWLQNKYPVVKLIPVTLSVTICLFYGGLIEVVQAKFFAYRSGDWGDFLADAVGTFAGTIPFYVYKKFIHPRYENKNV